MIVGVLTVDLAIFEAQTLKDKRRVVQSLKQRVQNAFNVSVAEVDHEDMVQRCLLGMAMVCNESRPIHAQFDKIVELCRGMHGVTLLSYDREML